jgi:hypothetical protein
MAPDQSCPQRCSGDERWAAEVCGWLGGVELDATEVLGVHEAVLAGAHESGGCPVVAVERDVEVFRDEDVVSQRVLQQRDRLVAVEAANTTCVIDAPALTSGSSTVR